MEGGGGGNEGVRERRLTEERIALNLFPFVERQWPPVSSACLFPKEIPVYTHVLF